MRYGLGTLLIVAGVLPPVIGGLYWAYKSPEMQAMLAAMAMFAGAIVVAGIVIFWSTGRPT